MFIMASMTAPASIMYFVKPSGESQLLRLIIYAMISFGFLGAVAVMVDQLWTKIGGNMTITYHSERKFPRSLQKIIYDTLKNPYRWTDEHPWKKDGWKPYCVSLNRQVEGKYGRPVTIMDKITDLEEVYTSGPELCLWNQDKMYCVRKLESIADDRSRLEYVVAMKGDHYPYESERILYTVELVDDKLKVAVYGEATVKSRFEYFLKKPKHGEMEASILDYIASFEVKVKGEWSVN